MDHPLHLIGEYNGNVQQSELPGLFVREKTKEKMKTIILGPSGKMGKAMVKCAHENPDIEIVGAVGPKGRDYIGKDIGLVCNLGKLIGIRIHDSLNSSKRSLQELAGKEILI